MNEKHLQATTHCGCNKHGAGKWMTRYNTEYKFRYQTCLFPYQCFICLYNLWYDAYFDDMMFDLKGMNQ